jgi:hypothetical protein
LHLLSLLELGLLGLASVLELFADHLSEP